MMTQEISTYDLARWRPLTPEQFIKHFAEVGMAADEPSTLTVAVTTLPDGRTRTVVHAACTSKDGTQEVPYLLMLHDEESNRQNCFVLSDGAMVLHR